MEKREDHYNDTFPTILRKLMDDHPLTGDKTTQKELAEFLQIRPQTVSLYTKGETQPTQDTLCKMAQYFEVSLDYLLTGVSAENIDFQKKCGLTETAIKQIELVNDFGTSAYADDSESVIAFLNVLLEDHEFYGVVSKVGKCYQQISETDDQDNKEFLMWNMERAVLRYLEEKISK